jgi:hypothetical protein
VVVDEESKNGDDSDVSVVAAPGIEAEEGIVDVVAAARAPRWFPLATFRRTVNRDNCVILFFRYMLSFIA